MDRTGSILTTTAEASIVLRSIPALEGPMATGPTLAAGPSPTMPAGDNHLTLPTDTCDTMSISSRLCTSATEQHVRHERH